jgi:hypothetical protein
MAFNKTKASRRQGGQTGPTGQIGFLNPERVTALLPKYANKLGKTIESISITYTSDGVNVQVDSLIDENGQKTDQSEVVSLADFHQRLGDFVAPSDDDRLRSLRRKFELRLNMEFPSKGPDTGSDHDIQVWMDSLPFAQRRALQMSQKAFEKAYPEGFRA